MCGFGEPFVVIKDQKIRIRADIGLTIFLGTLMHLLVHLKFKGSYR